MSANNWAVCPRCRARAEDEKAGQQAAVAEAYGKVPVEEFDALRAEASKTVDLEGLRTFREDWDLGVFTGGDDVEVHYTGGCTVCGLKAKVDTRHPLIDEFGKAWAPGA